MKTYYFSKTENGFFTSAALAPTDAVEVSSERWSELMDGQSDGKLISSDMDGYPILIALPPPSHEEQVANAEIQKASLMNEANVAIAPLQDAVDLGIATDEESITLTEWKKYRVMLMRVDTAKPVWPTTPASAEG
nr:MAG TPA_asm: tail fiber assembly protein [Caudoviricetes sp.]